MVEATGNYGPGFGHPAAKRRTRLLVGSVAKLNKVPCVYFFTNQYVAAPEQLTGEAPAVL